MKTSPSPPIKFGTVYKLDKTAYHSVQHAQSAVINRYPEEDTPDIFTFCSEPPEDIQDRRQAYYVCTKNDGKLANIANQADAADQYLTDAMFADTPEETQDLLKDAKKELPSSVSLIDAGTFATEHFIQLMRNAISF